MREKVQLGHSLREKLNKVKLGHSLREGHRLQLGTSYETQYTHYNTIDSPGKGQLCSVTITTNGLHLPTATEPHTKAKSACIEMAIVVEEWL